MKTYHISVYFVLISLITLTGTLIATQSSLLATSNSSFPGSQITAAVAQGLANHAPVANPTTIIAPYNSVTTFELTASDADAGDTLTYYTVSQPAHGRVDLMSRLSNNAQRYTYTPTGSFSGSDSFAFKVSDGKNDSNIAQVNLSVIGAPPVSMSGPSPLLPQHRPLQGQLF